METGVSRRRLSLFSNRYERGRPLITRILWFCIAKTMFERFWFPASLRPSVLRVFGAQVGGNVLIRHYVRFMWPWKVSIGEDSWIGEGSWFITLERIDIGANVCVSQDVMLCTGSHDHRRADFAYRNAPILVSNGAWLAARAVLLPGVCIGIDSVVAAAEVVRHDVPDGHMLINGKHAKLPTPQ